MAYLKTKEEIKTMAEAGRIAAKALGEIEKHIKSGVTGLALDKTAQEVIKKEGAKPSFMTVEDYQYSICVTENELVVHGIPTAVAFKEGDIVGIDIGALYQGFHSDMAETFAVGRVSAEVQNFLKTGKEALNKAIAQAKVGNRVGDISSTIQTTVEKAGYSVVKELVGHGVGTALHEDPLVPGIGKKETGPVLKEGMVIAIEVIYNQGKGPVVLLEDGWTIASRDGSLSGLFERTVAITKKGPVVLTQ
ncbi:MAG: type I methionyl aminopeptidase [bacterium]|nr:type I methionyl aminopeptidase [bacterium]